MCRFPSLSLRFSFLSTLKEIKTERKNLSDRKVKEALISNNSPWSVMSTVVRFVPMLWHGIIDPFLRNFGFIPLSTAYATAYRLKKLLVVAGSLWLLYTLYATSCKSKKNHKSRFSLKRMTAYVCNRPIRPNWAEFGLFGY